MGEKLATLIAARAAFEGARIRHDRAILNGSVVDEGDAERALHDAATALRRAIDAMLA